MLFINHELQFKYQPSHSKGKTTSSWYLVCIHEHDIYVAA